MKGVKKRPSFFLLTIFILIMAICTMFFLSSILAPGQIAQGSNLIWEKTFGGSGDDRAFYATAANEGYLVVGSSASFNDGKTAACIVCLDNEGNVIWNNTYIKNDGSEFRYAQSIADGFILVGNTFLSSGDVKGYLMKVDNQGNLIWDLTITPLSSAENGINKLFSAITIEETIIAVGLATPNGENSNSDIWIIRIDNSGNVIWNKTYGETSNEAARSISVNPDGTFMIAGYTDQNKNNDYDFLILKIDSYGNMLWNQTYGGIQSDKAYTIASTQNNCIIAGDTRSKGSGDSDAWVIKIDLNGKLIWDRTLGGIEFDSPTYITLAEDEAYLVAGTTFSYGNGQRDFWLFRINNLGEVELSTTVGRSNYEEAYSIIPANKTEYFMAGWTKSLGEGHYDFYFVKLASKTNQ